MAVDFTVLCKKTLFQQDVPIANKIQESLSVGLNCGCESLDALTNVFTDEPFLTLSFYVVNRHKSKSYIWCLVLYFSDPEDIGAQC